MCICRHIQEDKMGGCAPVVFYSRCVAFSLHRKFCSLCNKKPSGQDAHAAMRNFIARRCCGGAQSGTRPSKIEGGVEVGLPTLFYSRKNLVTWMYERSFLSQKCAAKDAHAAMRNFTARRCSDGAQSGTRPSRLRGRRS